MNCGIDINANEENGQTALYLAVNSKTEVLAKVLLDYGVDINMKIFRAVSISSCDKIRAPVKIKGDSASAWKQMCSRRWGPE